MQEGEHLAWWIFDAIENLCKQRNSRETIVRDGKKVAIGDVVRQVVPVLGDLFTLREELRERHAELIMTEYARDEKVDEDLREMQKRDEAKAKKELEAKLQKIRDGVQSKMEKNRAKQQAASKLWVGCRPTASKYNNRRRAL